MKLTSYFYALLCVCFFGSIKCAEQAPITPTNASSNQDSTNSDNEKILKEISDRLAQIEKNSDTILKDARKLEKIIHSCKPIDPIIKARFVERAAKYHFRGFSL